MTRLDTISIALVADIKQFRDSMRQATAEMNLTSDRMRQVSERAGQIGSALTTRISLPLAAVGAAVGKMGADFQASMNMVAATTGATGEDIQSLSNLARELGTTTQFSASQAADAMYFLASSGMNVDEVMGALPNTLLLAAAAQMDLAEASDISTNILSGYGLEVEELARANDVLVATFQNSNTNVRQLGEAFQYVGPVAKGAGLEFEETSAILGMLGNAGIQASMAGTTLRGTLTALLNPTKQEADVLERLGIVTKDSSGNLLGMSDIIRQLEASGASTADVMQLFGDRAGPGMAALLQFGGDALDEMIGKLKDAGGTAKDVADIQMEGLKGALAGLRSAFEGLAIAIFESGFGDFLEEAARKITVFGQMLAAASPETLRMATIIAGFAVVIPPTIVVLATLTTSVITLATAVAGLNLAFLASPAGLAAMAAGAIAVGAGVGLAKKEYDDFMRTLDEAQREVDATARSAESAGQRTGSSFEDAERAARSFADQLGDLANAQADTTEAAGDSAEQYAEWAKSLRTDIDEMVNAHVDATNEIQRAPINIVFGNMSPEEIRRAFYEDVRGTYLIAARDIAANRDIRDAQAANAMATIEFRERLQDMAIVGAEAAQQLAQKLSDIHPALQPVGDAIRSFVDDLSQGVGFSTAIGNAIGAIKTGGLAMLIGSATDLLIDMFSKDSAAKQRADALKAAIQANEEAIRQNTNAMIRQITSAGTGELATIAGLIQQAIAMAQDAPVDPETGRPTFDPFQFLAEQMVAMGLATDIPDAFRRLGDIADSLDLDLNAMGIERLGEVIQDLIGQQLNSFRAAFDNLLDMMDLRGIEGPDRIAQIISFLQDQVGPGLSDALTAILQADPAEVGDLIADIIENLRTGGGLIGDLGAIGSEDFISVLMSIFGMFDDIEEPIVPETRETGGTPPTLGDASNQIQNTMQMAMQDLSTHQKETGDTLEESKQIQRLGFDALLVRMTSLEAQVETLIGTNRNGFDDVAAAVRT